jgi:hypothetical protein
LERGVHDALRLNGAKQAHFHTLGGLSSFKPAGEPFNRARSGPVKALETGSSVPDQADRSFDRVRVTPVKIPIPSMMTHAMTT